jgi:hypothetical protein
LTGQLGGGRETELNEPEASRLVVALDRDSGRNDLAELSELLMQVFVSPVHSESFYENVGLGLAVPQEVFVVGERAAGLAVQLWELDVVEETSCLDDVGEAAKGVIEVLEGWPLEHDLTVTDLLLEELVKFNEGEFLG